MNNGAFIGERSVHFFQGGVANSFTEHTFLVRLIVDHAKDARLVVLGLFMRSMSIEQIGRDRGASSRPIKHHVVRWDQRRQVFRDLEIPIDPRRGDGRIN